jgi:hypothetical protein
MIQIGSVTPWSSHAPAAGRPPRVRPGGSFCELSSPLIFPLRGARACRSAKVGQAPLPRALRTVIFISLITPLF